MCTQNRKRDAPPCTCATLSALFGSHGRRESRQPSVRSIPGLAQWHVKDPGHSAKSAGGRLHLNTHIPLTQRSRSGLTMPLSRHSAGTYPETSSHATCQGTFGHSRLSSLSRCGWTDPGIKSGMCARTNLHLKKIKIKHRRGMNSRTFSHNPCKARKKPPHHHH